MLSNLAVYKWCILLCCWHIPFFIQYSACQIYWCCYWHFDFLLYFWLFIVCDYMYLLAIHTPLYLLLCTVVAIYRFTLPSVSDFTWSELWGLYKMQNCMLNVLVIDLCVVDMPLHNMFVVAIHVMNLAVVRQLYVWNLFFWFVMSSECA